MRTLLVACLAASVAAFAPSSSVVSRSAVQPKAQVHAAATTAPLAIPQPAPVASGAVCSESQQRSTCLSLRILSA